MSDLIDSLRVDNNKVADILFALKYLKYYGYLNITNPTPEEAKHSIQLLQNYLGFGRDGQLCAKTLSAIKHYRCGVKDVSLIREFVRWKKNRLTYKIVKKDSDLSPQDWDNMIREGCNDWEAVANIKYTETSSDNADVLITTGSGRRDGFDGPNGVLAYAYLPDGRDSQLKLVFDASETFVLSTDERGLLVKNIFEHEVGHINGLEHSRRKTALMYPTYSSRIGRPQLDDDIPRIVDLYGEPVSSPIPPSTKTYTINVQGQVRNNQNPSILTNPTLVINGEMSVLRYRLIPTVR